MKQPLVKPKEDSSDKELQDLILFYEETLGFCPNSVKTMHHRPRIAYAFIEMNKAVMENKGRVTSALKRMIGYISSHATGCRYCEAHTIRAAERYGASAEQLENIWEYKTHPAFSDAEKAALDLALHAATVPNSVTDAIAENARKYWNEGEIVEMMGVIALFGYLNRWNDSMGTEMEQGAVESGKELLSKTDWSVGKHAY
ncbi:MAG: carboxymuconolactone decarboxylase family protein [Flavobacteriales bacterium]|nr:carboxymuconolactone decarboxylase family protein [Flavobacteriales bacterium]MCB9198697.1 carboxymuconolactone decarboxylase family protein [Flavobacteriales bacterium]